jgi:hypothetical protein
MPDADADGWRLARRADLACFPVCPHRLIMKIMSKSDRLYGLKRPRRDPAGGAARACPSTVSAGSPGRPAPGTEGA